MSHTQHTPGPWSTYRGEDTNYWWIIRDAESHELGSGDGGFEKADAHLIAAAPAMLAVLKHYVMAFEKFAITNTDSSDMDHAGFLYESAQLAIKQATGEME